MLFSLTSALVCKNIFNIRCSKKVRDRHISLVVDYNLKTERLNNNTRRSYVTVELIIQTI